jgi:hypothetical protein
MAQELFGRQIPLDVVEVAFVLGSARRLARDPKRIVPPIRCLAYFLPVIEEVLAEPPSRSYIQYLRLFISSRGETSLTNSDAHNT